MFFAHNRIFRRVSSSCVSLFLDFVNVTCCCHVITVSFQAEELQMPGFWDENFWLPPHITWDTFKGGNETLQYPQVHELKYTVLVGTGLLVFRILLESFVFLPIGAICGWVDTSKESLGTRVLDHLCFGFAGKRKFKRVAESAWRFTYYFFAFIVGYFVLRNEPQFTNINDSWAGWPHHHVSNSVWWYYMFETGFYWSLLFSTFVFDVRRSDFWEMMLHHALTILLLSMSFAINFTRVGTMVVFSHDAADIFIDLAKLFRYAGWGNALNALFIIFMTVWIGTRLIYYPFWVINSILFVAPGKILDTYSWIDILQPPIAPRIIVGMLCALVVLHVFWTYVLLKIAVESVQSGSLDDIREDESEGEDVSEKKKLTNGSVASEVKKVQ